MLNIDLSPDNTLNSTFTSPASTFSPDADIKALTLTFPYSDQWFTIYQIDFFGLGW